MIRIPLKSKVFVEPIVRNTDIYTKEDIRELIIKYAKKHKVNEKLAVRIAVCESGLRFDAVGDHKQAYGVYQWHEETFLKYKDDWVNQWREKANKVWAKDKTDLGLMKSVWYHKKADEIMKMEWKNTENQIELFMFAALNKKLGAWTCK